MLAIKDEYREDTCYNEIGLCVQNVSKHHSMYWKKKKKKTQLGDHTIISSLSHIKSLANHWVGSREGVT